MKLTTSFFILFSLIATTAQADLVGTWSVADEQAIKIYYKDNNHIRMDVGNGTYMLVLKDKTYSVMNQGGQLMVMDMAAMGGAMKAIGGAMAGQVDERAKEYDTSTAKITKTGRTETVAGYKGDVYKVSVQGPNGLETAEFVTSNHKDIIAFQKAFMTISERMAKSFLSEDTMKGFKETASLFEKQQAGGMLRYGNDMILTKLENKGLDSGFYNLPKNAIVMSLPSFGQ